MFIKKIIAHHRNQPQVGKKAGRCGKIRSRAPEYLLGLAEGRFHGIECNGTDDYYVHNYLLK
jgi:hypothetical protein